MKPFPSLVSSRTQRRMLAAALGVSMSAWLAGAQTQQTPAQAQVETGSGNQQNGAMNPSDANTYATGRPLEMKSQEGFWGHVNPFARKKWVNRQLDPVKDRLNELDQLSAKNARDIKDVDSRAQAGISRAQTTADAADKTATDASLRADQAGATALHAASRIDEVGSTVQNLDQYRTVTEADLKFRSGSTLLSARAKSDLDAMATQLEGKQGYIVNVQGFAPGAGQTGLETSQKMTNSVVRYLVVEHHIPMYRIHQVALGNAKVAETPASGRGSLVHVTLMENSLAAMNQPAAAGGSPIGATQNQPSPQGSAAQPAGKQ